MMATMPDERELRQAAVVGEYSVEDEILADVDAAIASNDVTRVYALADRLALLPPAKLGAAVARLRAKFGPSLASKYFDQAIRAAQSALSYYPLNGHPPAERSSPAVANLTGFKLTDSGNAERLHALHGGRFRFCKPEKTFYVWDGARWAQDDRDLMYRLARDTARELYKQAWDITDPDQKKLLAAHAIRSESAAAISNALKLVGSIEGVSIIPGELDLDAFLLNVANGTLSLKSGELREHRQEDLITKLAPVAYDPKAKCPRWLRFLDEVFAPHPDIPAFLQRAVGYSMTADPREECLFLCYGGGRNGKGVFLRILSEVLGDYASTADFSTFIVRPNDSGGPTDGIANLRGRRLVRAEEAKEGARLAENVLKNLTGGDRIRARRLHENSYEFDPSWHIWLATNHKPDIRGTDTGIWSRIKLIPFEVSFEGREDRTLKSRLLEELPGILTWAVEGCLRWQEGGLEFPDAVLSATAEYRTESDQVGRLIGEECIEGPYCQTPARKLYLTYKKWAADTGEDVMTETAFGRRMVERGLQSKHTKQGKVYLGVGLRAEEGCNSE